MSSQQLPLFSLPDSPEPGPPDRDERRTSRRRLGRQDPLSETVERFQPAMRLKGFTQNTINSFQDDLRLLVRFLGPNHPIGDVANQDLSDFMDYLVQGRGRPCNAKSYARRLTTLKVFFGWLAEAEVIPVDPAAALTHKPVSTPLPDILFDEEVERLLEAGQRLRSADKSDSRPLFLFRLLLGTGIKKAECMALKLGDLDLSNDDGASVFIRYDDARNRHKERRLATGPALAGPLRDYRAQYYPQIHVFECTHRNLEYVLRDLGRLAGVKTPVSFETIRMTCAVRDFRRGVPLETLRVKLGLSRISWEETSRKIERLAAAPL